MKKMGSREITIPSETVYSSKPQRSAVRKVRPQHATPIAASLILATLFTPLAHAAPPPQPTRTVTRTAPAPKPSAYNTRNKSGKEVAVPAPKKTAVKKSASHAAAIEEQSVDYLLFCNQPERLTGAGAYADAKLIGGRTYRIFFHYRNTSGKTAPLALAFHGTAGKPLSLAIRKGIAEPQNDPPRAGRQALVRYMEAKPVLQTSAKGAAKFPIMLRPYDTASGIVTVRASQDCRFRMVFNEGKRTVRGARITAVPAPRREISISLTDKSPTQYFRIGGANDLPTDKTTKAEATALLKQMDGSYGLVYSFAVKAPAGRKVRVTFSPRGGQSGMVALLNGVVRTSDIIGPAGLAVFAETQVSESGFGLVTMPFGGVFYPVELAFHLL